MVQNKKYYMYTAHKNVHYYSSLNYCLLDQTFTITQADSRMYRGDIHLITFLHLPLLFFQ